MFYLLILAAACVVGAGAVWMKFVKEDEEKMSLKPAEEVVLDERLEA